MSERAFSFKHGAAFKRGELDREADELGLDKTRIKNLAQALEAVWEARYKARIVDLSGAREGSDEEEDPAVLRRRLAHDPRDEAPLTGAGRDIIAARC